MIINLQLLRALAAYLVIAYHLRPFTTSEYPLLVSGQSGVDIFFVISGFIIAESTRGRGLSPQHFLNRRFARVVPLYWVATAVAAAGSQVMPLLAGGAPAASEVLLSLAFIPYYNNEGLIQPVIYLGWTLNFEMIFYLIFATGMAVAVSKADLFAAGVLIALVVAGSLFGGGTSAIAKTLTSSVMLEFVLGLMLARFYGAGILGGRAMVACAYFAAALSLALLGLSEYLWPDAIRLVKWGLPAAVLVASVLVLERSGHRANWPSVVMLGNASYALYLVHPFVLKLAALFMARFDVQDVASRSAILVVSLAGVTGLAIMVYYWFELPMLRSLSGSRREARLFEKPGSAA